MSEVTRQPKTPVQRHTDGGGKEPTERGSRFPVQLRGAGLEAQERALTPDAQPGFEAADAARRPVQMRATDEKPAKEAVDGAPAATPVIEAAKKPKFTVMPGKPKANKMAAGADGKQEIGSITLPFRHKVIGGKNWNADSIHYSGSFTDDDMATEVLETLKRITSYDMALQELTDDDLAPHVAKLVASMKAVM